MVGLMNPHTANQNLYDNFALSKRTMLRALRTFPELEGQKPAAIKKPGAVNRPGLRDALKLIWRSGTLS
jgi:hypothetical protein